MAKNNVSAGNQAASKGLTEIMVTLNITRDFLTLVELLNTLPNMQKTPYDVTRSLYQAVSQDRDPCCAAGHLGDLAAVPATGERVHPAAIRG